VDLKTLTKLKELYIGNTKITDAGREKLKQALPNTRVYVRTPRSLYHFQW